MTETVEIREQGSNLLTEAVFGLKRELRSMLGALSGDIMSRCEATLDDPAIRARIRLELERWASEFCLACLGRSPDSVSITFMPVAR